LLVLSLGKLLGAVTAGAELTAGSALVVVECRSLRFALLTDKVIDIQSIAQDVVQSAEQGEEFDGYLIGQSGTLVGLLNLERLITEQRMHSYRQYLVRNPALGRQDKSHSVSGVKRRFLSFMIGREYCGIPLESVQRVEESSVLTELPRTGYKVLNDDEAGRGLSENSLSGVVQIQGKIVPVIDLRYEFGLSAASGHTEQQGSTSQQARVASLNSVFLVVSVDDNSYAMRVDAVERVVSIAQEAIEPVQHASSDFIESVGRLDGRLISLLSLEPLKQGAT
jgi:chemotaxis signal transduction protein